MTCSATSSPVIPNEIGRVSSGTAPTTPAHKEYGELGNIVADVASVAAANHEFTESSFPPLSGSGPTEVVAHVGEISDSDSDTIPKDSFTIPLPIVDEESLLDSEIFDTVDTLALNVEERMQLEYDPQFNHKEEDFPPLGGPAVAEPKSPSGKIIPCLWGGNSEVSLD